MICELWCALHYNCLKQNWQNKKKTRFMKCESLEILPTLKGAIYCLWNNAVKVLQSELNQK